MSRKKLILLLIFLSVSTISPAQYIIDSAKTYNYPVKEGVIYNYDFNRGQGCISPLSIVSVITLCDSALYFQDGDVVGVFRIDDIFSVVIRSANDEYITYSNLHSTYLKKGMRISRGDFIGTIAISDDEVKNSLDIIIMKKTKDLGYDKCFEYIKNKISSNSNCLNLISCSL